LSTINGTNELLLNLQKMADRYGDAIAQAGFVGGEIVRGIAVKSIQSQSSGDSVIRYRNGGAEYSHVASKEGDAPNTDTGRLVNSIKVEVDGHLTFVGTSLKYGKWLEFGTKRMSARPWLNPALEAGRPQIRMAFDKVMSQTTRKGIK